MKEIRGLLAAATVASIGVSPALAADAAPKNVPVQIAENTPSAAMSESRNVTATRRVEGPDYGAGSPGTAETAPPAAARALMALGIALMIKPDIFGGAFSN